MLIISWIKNNKLSAILLLIVAYFLLGRVLGSFFGLTTRSLKAPSVGISDKSMGSVELGAPAGVTGGLALPNIIPPQEDYTPQTDVSERLVIQESNISLLVKDVVDVRNKILEYANTAGGYMVNVSTSSPQEAPYATITIRVPTDKLQDSLDYFHSLSVKVVSENLVGRDVTDQYVDIDKRIETYEKTKVRFEAILDQATKIDDITRLTREIINIQSQIDSLKGRQQSLEQNAKLAKLTIHLSTDEIALPYAPSETFRPRVIFKLAVRSLVGFGRNLATWAIWIGVYAVVWVPALLLYLFLRRWWKKRKPESKPAN